MDYLLSYPGEMGFSAAERVRYIANWDPKSLMRDKRRRQDRVLPLHRSITNFPNASDAFRAVLESGIKHFPSQLGFLFHKDVFTRTPFRMACNEYGKEIVSRHTREIFREANYSIEQIVESLLTLSISDAVHVEGVYFVLRGEYMRRGDPSTIVRALCGRLSRKRQRRSARIAKRNSKKAKHR